MAPDTKSLRQWMDGNGLQGVPIDINEAGGCDVTPQTTNNGECPPQMRQSSAAWGGFFANFATWALCAPALHVESVQAEWWGAFREPTRT